VIPVNKHQPGSVILYYNSVEREESARVGNTKILSFIGELFLRWEKLLLLVLGAALLQINIINYGKS
jgi:hypothetical protein